MNTALTSLTKQIFYFSWNEFTKPNLSLKYMYIIFKSVLYRVELKWNGYEWIWIIFLFKVYVELHPHGIAPIFKKNVLNLFICIKLIFFSYNFSFFIWIISLVDTIGEKTHPETTKPKLRIWCNPVWVQYQVNTYLMQYSVKLPTVDENDVGSTK